MGHVDRVDKNVSLTGIRLRRCKNRYHRQIFLWLIAAVAFNNVLVLFLVLYPAAEALSANHEKSGFGFKHWFQHELASVLMQRGVDMYNVQRRRRAADTFIAWFRSGKWKSKCHQYKNNRHNSNSNPPVPLRMLPLRL